MVRSRETGHSGSWGTVNLSLFIETDTNKSHYRPINITGHAWGSPNKIAAQLEKPFNKVKIIRKDVF